MNAITKSTPSPITGRHVLIWMIAFFGVIFAVNGAFVFFALTSWPGLTTGRAYEEGLAYNETLAAAQTQSALGWQSRVSLGPTTPKGRVLDVWLRNADGLLSGATVTAHLRRPLSEGLDMTVALKPAGPGRYTGMVRLPALGRWRAEITAGEDGVGRYRMAHELVAGKDKP